MFERLILLFTVLLDLAIVLRGVHLWKGAIPGRHSGEYKAMLADVNTFHWLRAEPEQQQLTRQQIRRWGMIYIILGTLILAILAVAMFKGLPLV